MERSTWRFYTKKRTDSPRIVAMQWFGHSPFEPESNLVRYFRHPDVSGDSKCELCDIIMHDHGWIDSGGDGQRVCPDDWILKIGNHFYACRPDYFIEHYEKFVNTPRVQDRPAVMSSSSSA